MVALNPEASLEVGRRLLEESLPWSFAGGALVLVLAPSVDDEEALENPDAVSVDEKGDLWAQFVLVVRNAESGEILDAHEQPVLLIPNLAAQLEGRLKSYLRGIELALERSVRVLPPEQRLPMHFVFPEVLADDKLETGEDFARALSAPERLGAMK